MYRSLLRAAPALAACAGIFVGPSLVTASPSKTPVSSDDAGASSTSHPGAAPTATALPAGVGMTGPANSATRPPIEVARSEDFQAAVLSDPGPVFVKVFSPSCTACKALMPVLSSAVKLASADGVPSFRLVRMDIDDNEELPASVDTPSTPRLFFFPAGDKSAPPVEVPMLQKGEEAQHPGLPTLADILALAAHHGVSAGTSPSPEQLQAAQDALQRMTWMYEMSAPVLFWVVARGLEEVTDMDEGDLPPGVPAQELADTAARLVALQGQAKALADAVQEGGTFADLPAVQRMFGEVMHSLLQVSDADVLGLEAVAGAAGLVLWANRCHYADPSTPEYAVAQAATGVMYGKRLLAHEAAVAFR